jgi:TPR repeat protein
MRHGEACFRLADLHEKGAGAYQDEQEAARMRKRACDLGYLPACPSSRST